MVRLLPVSILFHSCYATYKFPDGTLRWQAPELMNGLSQLTVEMDVYAFAITCIEILQMGRMPWPLMDDDAVRRFVLSALVLARLS